MGFQEDMTRPADGVTTKTSTITATRAPFHEFFGRDAGGSAAQVGGSAAPNGALVKAINESGEPVGSARIVGQDWSIAIRGSASRPSALRKPMTLLRKRSSAALVST